MKRASRAPDATHRPAPADIDVNSMLLFYEVVNCGSINQAATRLKIPKATISRRLRRLEQQVGTVLLKRGSQKLSLTPSGETLHAHCGKILTEAQEAHAAVLEVQTEVRGKLQLATAFGLRPWVSRALAAFTLRYPKVELVVDETHDWVDVSQDRYDLVVHLGPILNKNLPVRRFAQLDRGVYVSPTYLASRAPPRTPRDLLNQSCIVLQQQLDDGLWSSGQRGQPTIKPRARVSDIVVARDLVLAGVGYAILPHAICRQDVAAGTLVQVLTNWRLPPLIPAATYLEHRYIPLRVRAFLDILAEQFTHGPLQPDDPA